MDRHVMGYSECIEAEEIEVNSEALCRRLINLWQKRTSFKAFVNEIKRLVIGQEVLEDVLLAIYVYLEKIARGISNADTVLLAAPSGCGKTETYRAVKQYFKEKLPFLPCYQVDLSSISQTGFVGSSADSILNNLFQHSDTNGIGIVWMDEFDKKMIPSYEFNGGNVNGLVQYELLTILEGRECTKKSVTIDTNNTFFIGLGAFDFFREEKENESNEIGFGSEYKDHDHYDHITREDLIEAGGCYELIGRVSSIFNYHKLDEKDTRKIINLIRQKEGNELNTSVEIKENSMKELVKMNNSKFGCRLIRSAIHDRVMLQYKELKLKQLDPSKHTIVLSSTGDSIKSCSKEN